MSRVLILGGSGMLGNGVLNAFAGSKLPIMATVRGGKTLKYREITPIHFDAVVDSLETLDDSISSGDWIINCIGIIKPHIQEDNSSSRQVAISINSLFPYQLSRYAEARMINVIQIATDCVYSGSRGRYTENDEFDALDVYGKTKSLGEVPSSRFMHLRVSIFGPELERSTSLFEWVRNQPKDAEIFGFTDHLWNGVTTYHFGRLCRGVIENNRFLPGVTHVIPGSTISKDELVRLMANRLGRSDIKVIAKSSGKATNRTLETVRSDDVKQMWLDAGYASPPSISQMIQEMPL